MFTTRSEGLRKLDELIAEAERLCDQTRVTLTGELEKLRDRARYCLADLEPLAGDALREVSGLEFRLSPDSSQKEESETSCYKSLHRLKELLETVRYSVEVGQAPSNTTATDKFRIDPFPAPPGTTWEEILIRFLSDERVAIQVRDIQQTRNYAEMGYEDRRSGIPNLAWKLLRNLAERGGLLTQPEQAGVSDWSIVEKRIQEIRRLCRQLFQLSNDPFEPFHEARGYKAKFKIENAKSQES